MFDQMPKESEIDETKSNTSTTSSGSESQQQSKKICSDCGTNKTPLWRGGPAGPKSLCNACGIRSRKRRRALLGLTNQEVKKSSSSSNNKLKKFNKNSSRDEGGISSSSNTSEISGDEKMWGDVMHMEGLTWHRSMAGKKRRSDVVVLGEEEQAAVLLMAMAYSSVLV